MCEAGLSMSGGSNGEGLLILENGKTICSCRWKKCKRHGNCKECMEHHSRHEKHPLPYCKRKKESIEKKEKR